MLLYNYICKLNSKIFEKTETNENNIHCNDKKLSNNMINESNKFINNLVMVDKNINCNLIDNKIENKSSGSQCNLTVKNYDVGSQCD